MNELQKAYVAGLFDGEGCISITIRPPHHSNEKGPSLKIQVILTMCSKDTVEYLAKVTNSSDRVFEVKPRNERHRIQWAWRPKTAQAYDVLSQCEPYMVTKKRNAQIFLELIDIRKTSRPNNKDWVAQELLAKENITLNARGGMR